MKSEKPRLFILIGPPLSGKTSWIRNNYPDTKVISRDDIVMNLYGTKDYNLAFNNVDQKEVDRTLMKYLEIASKSNSDIIIDMTNMSRKRRAKNIRNFTDFQKIAVVFPFLTDEEYQIRNIKRKEEENKYIPIGVIKNMISTYQEPTTEEGFTDIILLK